VTRRVVAVLTFGAVVGLTLPHPAGTGPLDGLEGGGQLAVVTCIACIGGLTFAARGTLLGFLVNTWLYPDPTVACVYTCYQAVA